MENTGSFFVALNLEGKALPTTVELIPAGAAILGRDGRRWKLGDAAKVARNSTARMSRLVIDENHATDLAAPKGGQSPAMGWMTGLRAGEGGSIVADVEWTKRGERAVLNREYSFISPVFRHSASGEILTVLRAALTNTPNLQLPALNSENQISENDTDNMEETMNKKLCAELGLPETATETDVLNAVKALNSASDSRSAGVDLSVYATKTELNSMESRAVEAEAKLTALNAERLKSEAEAVVDGAVKAGKIAPASRDGYLALCRDEEGIGKLKTVFEQTPAIVGAAGQAPDGPPPSEGTTALNSEESALAKAMGYTDEEYAKTKEAGK